MVSYLKKNEIENSFGGKKNSMWGGSTNAYMLVYRKVKPDINLAKISIEQLTEYHREKLLQFNTVFVEERKEDKRQRDKLTLKVVYDKSNHLFFIDKHATLETAKVLFLTSFIYINLLLLLLLLLLFILLFIIIN